MLTHMIRILDKIQYSLIYMLYKTKFYKSGKGYIYRANQIIALIVGIVLSFIFLLVTNVKLTSYVMLCFFCLVSIASFFFFERNVTKFKLMAHRDTYRSRRKYLIPFYIVSFVVLVFFSLLNYWKG